MSGIKGNDSKEQVLNSIVYYGGLAKLKVVAINPTGDVLKQMYNIEELKEEPKYTDIVLKTEEGVENTYNKVVLHLANDQMVLTDKKDLAGNFIRAKETIKTRLEFLVSPEFDIARTGSVRTINALGNDSWQSEEKMLANEKMAWFTKYVPMHQAKKGEVALLNFVRNWMNVGSKDNCNFADYTKIAKGDVTELKSMAKSFPNNEITVLLGVKKADNGKLYQTVYNKCYSRPTAKTPKDIFNKSLDDTYGEFDAIYPSNLELAYVSLNNDADKPDDAVSAAPSTSSWV
jgi:hypothetical protein